jgi:hypothetical protein
MDITQEILEQIKRDAPNGWWNDNGVEVAFAAKTKHGWVLCARGGTTLWFDRPWFIGLARKGHLINEHGAPSNSTATDHRTTEFMRLVSILLSEEKEVSQRED